MGVSWTQKLVRPMTRRKGQSDRHHFGTGRVVLIDVTRLLRRRYQDRPYTGVDRVSMSYVRHCQGRALAMAVIWNRWLIFNREDSALLCGWVMRDRQDGTGRVLGRMIWNLLSNWRSPPEGCVLLHTGHSGVEAPSYAAHVRHYKIRLICFLHDLIPVTLPEFARPGHALLHQRRIRAMLSISEALICNSTETQKEIHAFARDVGIPVPNTVVAHLATIPKVARPLPVSQSREPYFVMLGTIEPRKNHLLILHVWRHLVSHGYESVPHLVIIGRRGWECEQVVDLLDRSLLLRNYVVEIGKADDNAVASWLTNARALLFPSFHEGFGLPLVEALGMNVPVIASDLPVFREIAGNVPELISPIDGHGWKEAILSYAQANSPRRDAQLTRLASWVAPTWEEHFQKLDGLCS